MDAKSINTLFGIASELLQGDSAAAEIVYRVLDGIRALERLAEVQGSPEDALLASAALVLIAERAQAASANHSAVVADALADPKPPAPPEDSAAPRAVLKAGDLEDLARASVEAAREAKLEGIRQASRVATGRCVDCGAAPVAFCVIPAL